MLSITTMPGLLCRALQVSLLVAGALAETGGLRGADVGEVQPEADVYPDTETGFDAEGPYDEVPSDEEADNPKQAIPGWQNTSSEADLRASAAWGQTFCTAHHTGFWCSGSTRVRCCKKNWGWVKCGTTVHSRRCGWGGRDIWQSSRPSWRTTSFCTSHHVGFFCSSHKCALLQRQWSLG